MSYETDQQKRNHELVVKYLPAVKKMAYKLHERLPNSVELEELNSIGFEELVKRSSHYDPALNDNFWGYVNKRVYGAMLDYLRSLDPVARSSRKLIKDIDKETVKYFNIHEKSPSDEHLAKALGEDIEKIKSAKVASEIYSVMPINEQLHLFDEEEKLHNTVEQEILIEKISQIIDKFKDRERQIIQLYYFEELNLKEISETLNITQSRISQIHKALIIKIRQMLGDSHG